MKKIIALTIGAALLFSACSSSTSQPQASANPETKIQSATPAPVTSPEEQVQDTAGGVVEKGGVRTFTVTGKSFNFDVKEMKVNKGDTVRVTFKNAEGFHDWVVDEFNTRTKQIAVGKEETVEFVADKTGTFEYYCSVGQHRANGMVGKLIVQ